MRGEHSRNVHVAHPKHDESYTRQPLVEVCHHARLVGAEIRAAVAEL